MGADAGTTYQYSDQQVNLSMEQAEYLVDPQGL